MRKCAKAVVAAAGSLAIALADGHLTAAELCLVVVAVGGVYGIRNTPPEN